MEEVICLNCNEVADEKHACIEEIINRIANQVSQIMEDHCGNSGLNWLDYHNLLMERLLLNKKSNKSPK